MAAAAASSERPPPPPQQAGGTTSDEIAAWRATMARRFRREPAYAAALEADSARQRAAETAWLSSPAFSRWRQRAVPAAPAAAVSPRRTSAMLMMGGGGGGYAEGDAALRAAAAASVVAAAPELHFVSARRRLEKALAEGRSGDVSAETAAFFSAKVQASTDEASACDFRHEAVVGLFATNALRVHIPNFPFVYALLELPAEEGGDAGGDETGQKAAAAAAAAPPPKSSSSAPASSPRRRRAATTTTAAAAAAAAPAAAAPLRRRQMLLVENSGVAAAAAAGCAGGGGGNTLEGAIANGALDAAGFYLVLVQILYALKFASEAVCFTHYDLHPRNVVLRAIAPPAGRGGGGGSDADQHHRQATTAYLAYENGAVFVAARFVAVFTEFGFSHVVARNTRQRDVPFGFAAPGRAELVEFGIFRDRANPLTDAYRLLLSCADISRAAGNDGVFAVCAAHAEYFTRGAEKIGDVLERQRDNWFYLPMMSRTRALSIDELLAHGRRASRAERWAWSRAVTTALPRGAHLVRCGAGFFGGSATIAAEAAAAGSRFVVPKCLLEFGDIISVIASRDLQTARESAVMQEFTDAFTAGFTRGASPMNAALAAARDDALGAVDRVARAVESLGDAAVTISAAPSDAPAAAAACLAICEYAAARELRGAAEFAARLYWGRAGVLPPVVQDALSALSDAVAALSATSAAAAAAALAAAAPDEAATALCKAAGLG